MSEDKLQFAPVVEGLEEVKVVSGEEEEDTVYKVRARLFRYARENDPPMWKERGIGEVRFLRHKESKKIRLLMRREKTLKVCANHYITPVMKLTPNVGSDRSWVWQCAADFAENPATEETLALRVKNSEQAGEFKAAFEQCAAINALIHSGDQPDALAAALAQLKVVEAGAGESAREEEPDVKPDDNDDDGDDN